DINCKNNTIAYKNVGDRSEVETILNVIDNLQEQEGNFLNAPQMKTKGLEKYKLLAQYNNVVLAACDVTSLDSTMHKVESIKYVTWEKDRGGDGNGVHTGHYFDDDNYEDAKEDFAARSGLVSKDKLFSETERIALFAGIVKLESLGENTNDDTKILETIKSKISNLIPDIEEKIYERNPQFQENEKYAEIGSEVNTTQELDEDIQEDYEQEI
ncbi:MAG TPA: hypothetical protein VIK78_16480, partial [Ruminiclostridium sp.]